MAMLAIAVLLCFLIVAPTAHARTYTGIVIDYETGQVLYEHRPDESVYPASLTKMMTLYMLFEAIENGKLTMDTRLRVSRNAAGKPASKLGLAAGSTITVRDAALSLITKSANDMATVIAESLASSEVAFARDMTARAHRLGMIHTSFRNANGLPNRYQKTTARDMANLGVALIRDFPQYYRLFATREFTWSGRTYRSTNNLLDRYPGVDGIKTGYTVASGFNLVSSTVRDGRRIVGVVIGGRTGARRDRQMQKLLALGFDRIEEMKRAGDLQVAKAVPPARPEGEAAQVALAGDAPKTGGLRLRLISEANAATPPAQGAVPSREGDYGVQVGAYGSRDRAMIGARQAVSAVPDMLLNRPLAIDELPRKTSPLYRARLLSFSRDEADRTCRALKAKKLDCLVIKATN